MVDLYEIPNDVIIEEPAYIITDALERFKLENSTGRLLNESNKLIYGTLRVRCELTLNRIR